MIRKKFKKVKRELGVCIGGGLTSIDPEKAQSMGLWLASGKEPLYGESKEVVV